MSEIGHMPPLKWLRAFHAAAEHESFSRAAETLGRSQATISQQISYLEQSLDIKLFNRLPRGVELTAEGAAYLPHIRSAFTTIATSTRDLFASPRVSTVTLTSPASIVGLWLAPRLPAMHAALPHVPVSIATIQRPVDYEIGEADLEIRYGDGHWAGRNKALLLREVLSPLCAPRLLQTGQPWQELPILAVTGARAGWADWCEYAGMPPLPAPQYRFDTYLAALAAARAGAGVLLGSLPLSREVLAQGELQRVSGVQLATNLGHWLTRDSDKAVTRASQAVWSWLAEAEAVDTGNGDMTALSAQPDDGR